MAESLSCGKANTIPLMVGLTRSILPFIATDPQDRPGTTRNVYDDGVSESLDRGTGSAIEALQ